MSAQSESPEVVLLTGHRCRRTMPMLGWWLVESAPGENVFLFGFDPEAQAIMAEHNRRWLAQREVVK